MCKLFLGRDTSDGYHMQLSGKGGGIRMKNKKSNHARCGDCLRLL